MLKDVLMFLPSSMSKELWNVETCSVTTKIYVHSLQGGCMVGWTNFGVMQSIFLPLKCDSNYYIVLYIMELLNGTHFEIIDFNIYVMKLIGMQNI